MEVRVKKYFTFKEAADELGIPLKTLYFYHETGIGPVVHKYGKHLRISTHDFQDWQSKHVL
jgi:predicted site-specific integrase-resolvase